MGIPFQSEVRSKHFSEAAESDFGVRLRQRFGRDKRELGKGGKNWFLRFCLRAGFVIVEVKLYKNGEILSFGASGAFLA